MRRAGLAAFFLLFVLLTNFVCAVFASNLVWSAPVGFGGGVGITISPDHKYVAYANWNGEVMCREVVTGKILWRSLVLNPTNDYQGAFHRFAVTPDWSRLLVMRMPNAHYIDTHVVDPMTGQLLKSVRVYNPGYPNLANLCFAAASRDNKLLAIGNCDGAALANMETGETIRSWRPVTNGYAIGSAFVKNDRAIAVGFSNGEIKILPIEGDEMETLTGGNGSLTLSRDGDLLAGIDYFNYPQLGGTNITVRRTSDLSVVHTMTPATKPIGIAFSDDGKFLLVGGGEQQITVWSMATGLQVGSIPAKESPSGGSLAVGGNFVAISGGSDVQMYTAVSGLSANLTETSMLLTWQSLMGPVTLQTSPSVEGPWSTGTMTEGNAIEFPVEAGQRFFRLVAP